LSGLSGPETEPLEQALRAFDEKTTRLLFSLLTSNEAGFAAALSNFDHDLLGLRVDLGLDETSKQTAKKEIESLLATVEVESTPDSATRGAEPK
jgi:hypothetical protein